METPSRVDGIQVQRTELAMENRRIRFRLWVAHGSRSEVAETILQAERTGEALALVDSNSHEPLGLVKVIAQASQPLGKTNFDQWIIHFHPEDAKAHETMATLPEIHPDPY